MAKATLKISGMSCEHCVKAVTDALLKTDGVSKAKVNLKKAQATVHFDASQVTLDEMRTVVTTAGYEVALAK